MLLKVGTKIRLSSRGRIRYHDGHSNPYDSEGTITSVRQDSGFAYKVSWPEFSNQDYRRDEIEEVTCS